MSVYKVISFIMLILFVFVPVCPADNVPTVISYQGKLLQPSGEPFQDGAYTITFSIYSVPNGGEAVWFETNNAVQVKGGLFNVLLGSTTPIDSSVFTSADRWFGIKVGGNDEMIPRQKIACTAYSFVSAIAQTVSADAISTPMLADGTVTTEKLAQGIATPPGTISMYAGSTAPTGWLLCQGQAVSRTTYAALFAVIGTTYGAGDGSTTFSLPNLKGRVPVGLDAAQAEFNALAKLGGEKTHTLTIAEMPAHNHQEKVADRSGYSGTDGTAAGTGYTDDMHLSSYSGSTGGGAAHNNLQPYLVVQYIIKI